MQRLSIRVLGKPEVLLDGQPAKFATRKALALLIYLVITGETHSREKLMALLWPDSTTSAAQASLRNTLARLRTTLDEAGAMVIATSEAIGIDPGADSELDLRAVGAAVTAIRTTSPLPTPALLQAAITAYRGEFLAEFNLADAPDFDHWVLVQRERWHRQLTAVLEHLTQRHLTHLALSEAIATSMRWVQHDPLDEAACRSLMQAYSLAGDRSAALQAYQACKATLAAEMDLAPDPATTLLAETIRLNTSSYPHLAHRVLATGRSQRSLPLVGRADDFAGLVAAYASAAAGTLQAVVVSGEAGMGKTRLVGEFLEWTALQGADVLQGRAFEAGVQLPYQPIVMALRNRLERENAPDDLLADVWLAELSRLLPELMERYPDLGQALVSVDGNEALAAARLFEAVARLGRALSQREPTVLFLDDWQWADAGSLELLHYLGRAWAASQGPILLVLTIRFEDLSTNTDLARWLANLDRAISVVYVWLYRLTLADVQAFVGAWAGPEFNSVAVIGAFGERLYRETVGIPFFLVETVKLLAEEAGLARGEGGIDLAALLSEVDTGMIMPRTVRQAILARLDQFDPVARSLLAAAAVLARDCHYQELCHISGVEELAGLPALDALLAGQIFVETTDLRHPYNFAHDKIRDVVYTEAGHSRRLIYHRRALYVPERASLPPTELAHHAEQAGLFDEARLHLRRSASEARQAFQNRLALSHLTRALSLTPPDADADRFGLLLARQEIYHLLGERGAQGADLVELARLATILQDDSRRAEVALHQARFAEATSDYAAASAAAEEAARLAEQAGNIDLVAQSTLIWGNSLWRQRQFPAAKRQLQQALAVAKSAGLPQIEANSLRALGMVAEFQLDYAEAKTCYEQSLSICRQTGDRLGEVGTLNNLGVVAFYQGDHASAHTYFELALDIRRLLGDRRGEGHALYNMGFVALSEGSYAEAQNLSEQALALFRETGDRWGEADALQCLGAIAANEERHAGASGFYEHALTLCRQIGHRRCEALLLRSLGHLFADQHQPDAARRHYEMAVPLALELDLPGYVLECQAGLADLAAAEGNLDLAISAAVEALSGLHEQALVQANEPFRVYLSCFRALRACHDERANDLLVAAYNLMQERAAKMPDAVRRQAFFENVPTNSTLIHEFEASKLLMVRS